MPRLACFYIFGANRLKMYLLIYVLQLSFRLTNRHPGKPSEMPAMYECIEKTAGCPFFELPEY